MLRRRNLCVVFTAEIVVRKRKANGVEGGTGATGDTGTANNITVQTQSASQQVSPAP